TCALPIFTAVADKVYFSLRKNFDDQADELWVTDGTVQGTTRVKSFGWWPPNGATAMRNFVAFRDRLFFQAGASEDYSLWSSDGTAEGTAKVHALRIGYPYQEENKPVVVGNDLYFSGDGELWITDGTQAGARQLVDVNQGSQNSVPQLLTVSDDKVYFFADDGYGLSLWNTVPAGELDLKTEEYSLRSGDRLDFDPVQVDGCAVRTVEITNAGLRELVLRDRKSTRLNSSHVKISYAVFCLKKK